jgi:hypothetical protein
MAQAAERPIWIILACIAAAGFAAPPVAAAERLAMVNIPMEKPAVDRVLTLTLDHGTTASHGPVHKGGSDLGLFGNAYVSPAAAGKPRAQKALRIDLVRFQVTRPLVGDERDDTSGTFLPSVVHVGVKQGATPGSKAVGVELPVVSNVVVESRLKLGGVSDTGIRFKIQY